MLVLAPLFAASYSSKRAASATARIERLAVSSPFSPKATANFILASRHNGIAFSRMLRPVLVSSSRLPARPRPTPRTSFRFSRICTLFGRHMERPEIHIEEARDRPCGRTSLKARAFVSDLFQLL